MLPSTKYYCVIFAGMLQNLAELARVQGVTVGSECRAMRPYCTTEDYCNNRGVCSEGWNRGICDCVGTDQTGDKCQTGEVYV